MDIKISIKETEIIKAMIKLMAIMFNMLDDEDKNKVIDQYNIINNYFRHS